MKELKDLSYRDRIQTYMNCESFYLSLNKDAKFKKNYRYLFETLNEIVPNSSHEIWCFINACTKALKYGCRGSLFSLDRNRFFSINRANKLHLSYKKMMHLFEVLEQEMLISVYRGFKYKDWHMTSCFTMSDTLVGMVDEEEAGIYGLERLPEEYVQIKDYETGLYKTSYRGMVGIREIVDKVQTYNEFLRKQTITLEGTQYKVFYKRVFADNLNGAGRFYSGFQNFHKETRTSIRINDEPCTEIDLSTLHPRIIATSKGITI